MQSAKIKWHYTGTFLLCEEKKVWVSKKAALRCFMPAALSFYEKYFYDDYILRTSSAFCRGCLCVLTFAGAYQAWENVV